MIKKIFHTADWHLKLDPKHHEVFKQSTLAFYNDVEKQKQLFNLQYNEGLIVIVGDLFDARNKSTNETKVLMGDILRKLSSLFKVIIVAGNHDLDVEDKGAMDSITPVIRLLNDEHIMYLKDSLTYEVEDILFANFSIFDDYKRPYVFKNKNTGVVIDRLSDENAEDYELIDLLSTLNTTKPIIGLYHGPLEGTKLDNNMHINYEFSYPPSHFYGCNMVMMGDIHTRQVLRDNDINYVYPSSLYQITYGEKVNNQGYVIWDIPSQTYNFVDLPSPVKLLTCKFESIDTIRNGKQTFLNCNPVPQKFDESFYIKPIWKDYMHNMTSQLKLEVRRKLATHYNIPLKNIQPVEVEYVLFEQGDITTNKVYNDLKDPKKREDLYVDFLKKKMYSEEDIKAFLEINSIIEKQLPPILSQANRTFKILNIRGQNFLSFGKFKRTIEPGINLIYSTPANQGGKSNLTRAIMFLLYGKVDYGVSSTNFEDIFNVYMKSNTSIVEGEVEINSDVFFLRRKLIKEKNEKISHTFEIYKYDDTGDSVINGKKAFSLKKRTAVETLKMFEQFVGDLNSFINISYFTQNSLERVLNTKPTERYLQFSNYLGLETFEKKQELAKNIYKDFYKNSVLSKYNEKELDEKLEKYKSDITTSQQEIEEIKKEIEDLTQKIEGYESEVLLLSNKLYQVDEDIYINPVDVEQHIINLTRKAEQISVQLLEIEKKYPNFDSINISEILNTRTELISKINSVVAPANLETLKKQIISSYSEDTSDESEYKIKINEVNNALTQARSEYAFYDTQINSLNREINDLGDKIICEYCGLEISNLSNKKTKLQEEVNQKQQLLAEVKNRGISLKEEKDKYEIYLEELKKNKKITLDSQLVEIELQIVTQIKEEKAKYESQLLEIDTIYQNYLEYSKKDSLLKEQLLIEQDLNINRSKLERYHKQANLILNNKANIEKIDLLKMSIKECKDHLISKNTLLNKLNADTCFFEQNVLSLQQLKTQYVEDLNKDKVYKNYIDLHGKDGIGKYLINAILPTVNKYLYDITSQLVDFNVLIDFDSSGIQFYIEKEGIKYPLYYGSGYEKTFSCLALHMVNMNMSINVIIPNILILDETFSTVAAGNLQNVYNLIKQMMTIYPSIDLVTHIEDVKQWADRTILVEKNEDNISYIN